MVLCIKWIYKSYVFDTGLWKLMARALIELGRQRLGRNLSSLPISKRSVTFICMCKSQIIKRRFILCLVKQGKLKELGLNLGNCFFEISGWWRIFFHLWPSELWILVLLETPFSCLDSGWLLSVNFTSHVEFMFFTIQVFTTHHWMVRIYKLKPPKNRIRGKTKKSKSVCTKL